MQCCSHFNVPPKKYFKDIYWEVRIALTSKSHMGHKVGDLTLGQKFATCVYVATTKRQN
jgi:hypothetical protein